MPNIFGKSQVDYTHLGAFKDAGMLDSHNKALAVRGRSNNFNALRDHHNPLAIPMNDVEANAQAIGFLTNNLQAVQSEIEEIFYLDFRLNEFVPIITNIPEGATTYSYRVVDRVGTGTFISNDGTNARSAGVSARNVPYNLEYAGIIAEWTLEDLRRAVFGGISLDTETLKAATEGAMDHIELVGLLGDPDYGFTGLVNNPDVTTAAAAAVWSTLTADQLVSEIQTRVTQVIIQTNEIVGRVIKSSMDIYLPVAQADLIFNTKLSVDADKTVWEYVSMNNLWTKYTGKPLTLHIVAELNGAGAGSSDRMIVGQNDTRVMEMAIPIMPRVITTINKGFSISAPMEYKISGLNVKRPGTMLYVDSI